jgi:hypothetical protein
MLCHSEPSLVTHHCTPSRSCVIGEVVGSSEASSRMISGSYWHKYMYYTQQCMDHDGVVHVKSHLWVVGHMVDTFHTLCVIQDICMPKHTKRSDITHDGPALHGLLGSL